jgi:hypothetical protein
MRFGDRSNLGASIANVQFLQVKQVKKVKLPCAQASSFKALLRLYQGSIKALLRLC